MMMRLTFVGCKYSLETESEKRKKKKYRRSSPVPSLCFHSPWSSYLFHTWALPPPSPLCEFPFVRQPQSLIRIRGVEYDIFFPPRIMLSVITNQRLTYGVYGSKRHQPWHRSRACMSQGNHSGCYQKSEVNTAHHSMSQFSCTPTDLFNLLTSSYIRHNTVSLPLRRYVIPSAIYLGNIEYTLQTTVY